MNTDEITEHVVDQDIVSHIKHLRLPSAGIEYAQKALESPSRLVGRSRFLAVSARFASQKLGQVIQAESHTCELPFLHVQELDDDVLACLDQPPPLFVESIDRRGRLHRSAKTPDFLVIRKENVSLVECKTSSELQRLVSEQPNNWRLDGTNYRYLPAEKPASALGIKFRVHDAGTIGPIYAANLSALVQAKRSEAKALDERCLLKALRRLSRHNGLTMSDLAIELCFDSVTPLLAAVLYRQLYVPLRWQLLSKPDSTTVYATETHLHVAELALKAAADIDCLREENFQSPIALSEKAFTLTIDRLTRLKRIRSGQLRPNRSDYRNMKALRQCEASGQSPLLGLAPAFHKRGSTKSLPDAAERIIEQAIRENYARPERRTVSDLHRGIAADLEKEDLSISYETVRQRVRNASRSSLTESREGYRAANAVMPPTPLAQCALRAGYAWDKAHVDSTPLDEKIWLASSLGKILARPNLYLLVDEATSYILAYWVCFDRAGDQAVACLFRDCIRRHGKLPCKIMHDQGSEYFSIYTETFTASTGVDLMRRPSGAPRWGSHVEAANGRITKLIIHSLPGNMQNDQSGRSSTTNVRSAAHASYELQKFMMIIEDQLMTWLNDRAIKGEIATPRQQFEASQKQFDGMAKKVTMNPDLLAHTAIPVRRKHRIDNAHGIQFKHRRYVGSGIKCPSLHGTKASIRWEPYNPCILYAHVKGKWARLTCRGYLEVESVPNADRLVHLYMRFNTATASRLAREHADHQNAARLHLELKNDTASSETSANDPNDTATDDPFDQARSSQIDDVTAEVAP